MAGETPDADAIKRLQLVISVVIGSLAVLSVVVALAQLWPTPWVDDLARSWFGHASWRLRIGGTFAVFGCLLLAALLIALLLKPLWTKIRRA